MIYPPWIERKRGRIFVCLANQVIDPAPNDTDETTLLVLISLRINTDSSNVIVLIVALLGTTTAEAL